MNSAKQLNLPDHGLCSEDLFWEKVAELGWGTETTDYTKLQRRILETWTPEFTASFRKQMDELSHRLYVALTKDIRDVGDDSFGDLIAHIVGLGHEKYEAVLADHTVAQKMVDDSEYKESFSYAIPYTARDVGMSWEDFLAEEKKGLELGESLAGEDELRRRFISRTQGDWAQTNPEFHRLGAKVLVAAFENFEKSEFCTKEIAGKVTLALGMLRKVADGHFKALTHDPFVYRDAVESVRDHVRKVHEDFNQRVAQVDGVTHWGAQNFGNDLAKFTG